MNIKILVTAIVIFTGITSIIAQVDTIYYNNYWGETVKENAEYFRLKPTKINDKYLVNDYFITGELQMSTQSLSIDEDVFEGEVKWYYKSGQIEKIAEYKNSVIEGLVCQYDSLGKLKAKCHYKGGKPYDGVSYTSEGLSIYEHYKEGKLIHIEKTDLHHGKAKLVRNWVNGHFVEKAYNIKGEFVGQGICDKDENEQNGVFACLRFNPMQIQSLEYVNEGTIDSTYHYYRNGQIKLIEKGQGDEKLDTYFDKTGKYLGSLNYKNGYPNNGIQLINFNGSNDNPK